MTFPKKIEDESVVLLPLAAVTRKSNVTLVRLFKNLSSKESGGWCLATPGRMGGASRKPARASAQYSCEEPPLADFLLPDCEGKRA